MMTKPDPSQASSPASSSVTLPPISQAHQPPQGHADLSLHHLHIASTARDLPDVSVPAIDTPATTHSPAPTGESRLNRSSTPGYQQSDVNISYSGRDVLDTSRRYSTGHTFAPAPAAGPSQPSPSIGIALSSPATGGSALASKRRSQFGGQTPTLPPTPELPSPSAVGAAPSPAIKSSSSGFHTFSQDFAAPHDFDHNNSTSAFGSVPHSPSFSISSFSGVIPGSTSISSIASTGQQIKSPALEHKHPIVVKDFDSIHILGPLHQAAIKTLCSTRVLSRIDTIGWYSILGAQKFPTIATSQDAYDIEMATTCMAVEFGANNAQTQNFNTLVLQLLSQIKLIKDQDYKGDIPSHAYNALFLTRVFLNHFISDLTSGEMISFFEGIILNLDAGSSSSAYEFYEEALNLLIVMASTQLQLPTAEPNERNYFLNLVLQNFSHVADQLTLRLLWNFTDQRPSPPLTGSIVYSAYSYLFAKAGSSPSSEAHPIADRSVLVLLLLHSQAKNDSSWEVFKKSIQNIRDERGSMMDDQKEDTIFTSFRKIFHVVCQQIHCEEVCLLLHVLLVENTYFRTYVLSRTDPETLYLPILRMVYEGVEGKTNYSQVYVLLVILLLFSQDDVFNDSIQKITMTYQPWFTERLLKSISLGGLATAIVIRTIQYNLAQHKDVYFHTNSLAILANMSNSLQDIHPYVSQRLVTLFDIVARRYQKLVTKHLQRDENIEMNADVVIYGDMVTLVLEIINSTLTHKLKANPQLVYSLLHKQEMFAYFRSDLKFKDLIHNIEQAVNYFQQKISEANIKAPTPEEVAQVIQTASRTWPPNLMKTFPDIKFEYEEEEQASDFFCPYVWSLLYRNTFVYWDVEKAKILHDYRTVGQPSS
ncbi:hypothetical protein BGZ75_004469 [Mortierella antarctica]|nr:hypothetical protein BGZ75_004469 [Mortierella antarctica]